MDRDRFCFPTSRTNRTELQSLQCASMYRAMCWLYEERSTRRTDADWVSLPFVKHTESEANMKIHVSRLVFGVREPNILIKNRIFASSDFVRNSENRCKDAQGTDCFDGPIEAPKLSLYYFSALKLESVWCTWALQSRGNRWLWPALTSWILGVR